MERKNIQNTNEVEKYFKNISNEEIWKIAKTYEIWSKSYNALKFENLILPIDDKELEKRGIPTELNFGETSITANGYFSLMENNMLDFDRSSDYIDTLFPFISAENGLKEYISSISNKYPNIDYYYYYRGIGPNSSLDKRDFVSGLDKKELSPNKEKISFLVSNYLNCHANFSILVGNEKITFDAESGIGTEKDFYRLQYDGSSCRAMVLYLQEYFSELYLQGRLFKRKISGRSGAH